MGQSEARKSHETLRRLLNGEEHRAPEIFNDKVMRRLFSEAETAVCAYESKANVGAMGEALKAYEPAEAKVEAEWSHYRSLVKTHCIGEVLRLSKSMRLLANENHHPHFEVRRRFDGKLRAAVQSANDSIGAFSKEPLTSAESHVVREAVETAWDRVNAAWDRCKAIDAEKGLKPSAVLPEFDGLEPKLDDLGTIEVLVTFTEAQFAAKYDAETAHKIWLRMLPADQRKAIKTAAKPTVAPTAPSDAPPETITASAPSTPGDHEAISVDIVIGTGDEAAHYTLSVNGNGPRVEPENADLLAYLATQIDGLDAFAYVKMIADDPSGAKTFARGFARFVSGKAKSPKRAQKEDGKKESAVREEGEGKKVRARK